MLGVIFSSSLVTIVSPVRVVFEGEQHLGHGCVVVYGNHFVDVDCFENVFSVRDSFRLVLRNSLLRKIRSTDSVAPGADR